MKGQIPDAAGFAFASFAGAYRISWLLRALVRTVRYQPQVPLSDVVPTVILHDARSVHVWVAFLSFLAIKHDVRPKSSVCQSVWV